jgi:hypothetical protein
LLVRARAKVLRGGIGVVVCVGSVGLLRVELLHFDRFRGVQVLVPMLKPEVQDAFAGGHALNCHNLVRVLLVVRVRSYSLSGQLGGTDNARGTPWDGQLLMLKNAGYPPKMKYTQINKPPPAFALAFVDESELSLNDGF